MDPFIVLGSAVVGLAVGLTGAGGGALMTPMLILLFSVKPSAAISSDLVASVLMRPVGAAVHLRRGTVNLRLVGWMAAGSVPAAFIGAYLLRVIGGSHGDQNNVEIALGAALLLGAAVMGLRFLVDRRIGAGARNSNESIAVRPLLTLLIGIVGGFIVGITSVGAGSLMIVLLMFVYPSLPGKSLVGTDLTQAIPLSLAAALGALVFGHVEFTVTASLVVGSVPAVFVGSLLSSRRVPDRFLKPAIAFIVLASGLKYVGLDYLDIGYVLLSLVVVGTAGWVVASRTRQPIPKVALPKVLVASGGGSELRRS